MCVIFFLMLRRPPRSTLFPTRRSSDLMSQGGVLIVDDDLALLEALPEALRLRMGGVTVETADSAGVALDRIAVRDYDARSEEHTSELQSRRDLVCRLLLEKKNQ